MGKYLKVIFFICIVSIILLPFTNIYAQEVRRAIPVNTASQGAVYTTKGQVSPTSKSNTAGLAANAVGCSAGQILGNIVQSGVSAVVGSLKSTGTGAASGITSGLTEQVVPVSDSKTRTNTAKVANKETGGGQQNILDAVTGVTDVSWDAIGFCLANAAIHYVAQSTVNWINSGFEGNPVFVDNPGQFFKDIADVEAGGFIDELGLGFLCSEFAPKVRIALVNNYVGKNYNDRAKCSFTNAERNLTGFINDYRQGGLQNYVEFVSNPANRAQSSYLMAQDELNRRVQSRTSAATQELNWGQGILSFKDCANAPEKIVNGKRVKDTSKCKTTTPGNIIEGQIESTLNLPKDRLSIADEFDEVIVALVNYLIKTALSDTLKNDQRADAYGNAIPEDDEEEETPVTTNPNAPRPLSIVCNASTRTAKVDEIVTFTAIAKGLGKNYSFNWTGYPSLPTSTVLHEIDVYFTAIGTTSINVEVNSGQKSKTAICPEVTITAPDLLQVSCSPSPDDVNEGETVTWTANVSGGNSAYTYSWSGDSNLTGNTQQINAAYGSRGSKGAKVTVTSGSQTITVACSDTVRVR